MKNLIAVVGVLFAALPLIACDSSSDSDTASQQCSMAANGGSTTYTLVNGVCTSAVANSLVAGTSTGAITIPSGYVPAADVASTTTSTSSSLVAATQSGGTVSTGISAAMIQRSVVQSTLSNAIDVTKSSEAAVGETSSVNRSMASTSGAAAATSTSDSTTSDGGSKTAQ